MRSNGWDNDTAALQLFSHLEGDNGPPAGGKRRLIRGGGGGAPLGSVVMFGPGPRRGSSVDCFPTTDDNW